VDHYDVIIIGTGAGGGTLAHRLEPSGKRILLLERGGYLPREPDNSDSREVFGRERYVTAGSPVGASLWDSPAFTARSPGFGHPMGTQHSADAPPSCAAHA
jgi:choline dehydrogenase-like flavoprotein